MAELAERVARLEERFDGVTAALNKLDARMEAGFAEMRAEFAAIRAESRNEFAAIRAEFGREFSGIRGESAGIRAEMNTQFRWLMGGIGSAALAILVAILAKG